MPPRKLIAAVAALLSISTPIDSASPFGLAAQTRGQTRGQRRVVPGTVLFAVSNNQAGTFLDPIVIISQGRYTRPPSGDAAIERLAAFATRYYRAGQKYRLLFGGGHAGSVRVKQWKGDKQDCSRTEASAEMETAARIGGKVMGLATNSESLGSPRGSRRAPTATERAAVVSLARGVYRQKGVPSVLLQDQRTINMTATDLNGDGKEEMIATFLVKRPKGARAAHVLLILAEHGRQGYRAAMVQYGQITEKDLMSGASLDDMGEEVLAEVLVDCVDLDRDGSSEVIITDASFEGVTYRIYKNQKGRWRKVYEFYNYRCAY